MIIARNEADVIVDDTVDHRNVGVQQNGSQASEQIAAKGLSVQPMIKVRPGWPEAQ